MRCKDNTFFECKTYNILEMKYKHTGRHLNRHDLFLFCPVVKHKNKAMAFANRVLSCQKVLQISDMEMN